MALRGCRPRIPNPHADTAGTPASEASTGPIPAPRDDVPVDRAGERFAHQPASPAAPFEDIVRIDAASAAGDVAAPVRARALPAVDDLGWSIVQATARRNGIPPHAPTLAAAAAAATGLTPTELEALRQDAQALQGGRFDPRVPCPLGQAQRAVRLRYCETRT